MVIDDAAGPVPAPGPGERCAVCRYGTDDFGVQDSAGTLRAFGEWWDLLIGPHRRHPVALAAAQQHLRALVAADVTCEVHPPRPVDLDATLALIASRGRHLGGVADRDTVAMVQPAVHDGLHRLRLLGRQLAADGCGVASMQGRVVGLHRGGGGVPKPAVDFVEVGRRGVVGDRQAVRRHHGRSWQAVCIWSDDVLGELAAQGHPVAPGAVGENIRVAGIDWSVLRPGVRLAFGDAVVAELSMPALPCRTIAAAFTGRDFRRISHERFAGVTRWYASVVSDGSVACGDAVVVEA